MSASSTRNKPEDHPSKRARTLESVRAVRCCTGFSPIPSRSSPPAPPEKKTPLVLHLYGNFKALLLKLKELNNAGKFQHFRSIKITGLSRLPKFEIGEARKVLGHTKIRDVETLDMSEPEIRIGIPNILSLAFPCLKKIDLSNTGLRKSALRHFLKQCRNLGIIVWNYQNADMSLCGEDMCNCFGLTQLVMNNANFLVHAYQGIWPYLSDRHHMFWRAYKRNLESVSIKNATFGLYGRTSFPLPQEALIKFVRNTPKLNFFSSDLTPENVAMLKIEYPNIIFE